MLKGVALFAGLAGIQQWLAQSISLSDIIFLALIAAFLISLEADYLRYKRRKGTDVAKTQALSSPPFLKPSLG